MRGNTHTLIYTIFSLTTGRKGLFEKAQHFTCLISFIDTCHFSKLKKLLILPTIYLSKELLDNTQKFYIKPASSENNSQYKSKRNDGKSIDDGCSDLFS